MRKVVSKLARGHEYVAVGSSLFANRQRSCYHARMPSLAVELATDFDGSVAEFAFFTHKLTALKHQ